MIKLNNVKILLCLVFVLVFASRLYFAFQTPYFNYDGYLNYQLVQHISETGKPLLHSELSYNGRDLVYSPVFYYVLAFFDIFLPLEFVLKVIPNLFMSLLIFVAFLWSDSLIKDKNISLLTAFFSGFIPVVFYNTFNNISVYSLALPLIFYLLYLFAEIENNLKKFLVLVFFLAILHPSSFLLLVSLLFFIVLVTSEDIKISNLKKEVIAFSIFLILFFQFLLYKKAFSIYGFSILRNNVPVQILNNYFDVSFLSVILGVGFLFIIAGLASIVIGWRQKNEKIFLLSALILSSLLLLWFKLIEVEVGLMFLSTALVITSAYILSILSKYLHKTRIEKYKRVIALSAIIIIIISLIAPSFIGASGNLTNETPNSYEILILEWIRDNSLPDVTVLAPIRNGHLINVIAKKRNVIDNNFLLAPQTSEKFKDTETIYSTKSEVKALDLMHKHNADYILVPVESEIKFGKVKWLDDENCFEGIFFGTPKVYKILC